MEAGPPMPMTDFEKAVAAVRNAKHVVAFSGAGISVESGIPPFRGPDGLWAKYDPRFLDIRYFHYMPKESWEMIKLIFYDFMGKAQPNPAHYAIARLEQAGLVKSVITQNIDNLHQEAGSQIVHEYHGTISSLRCVDCERRLPAREVRLDMLPPLCPACGGILKPDFVFFGEAIPEEVNYLSVCEAELADVMIVVGTTGEIVPACNIPRYAKSNGTVIIEVNIAPSAFTGSITDIYLEGKAGEVLAGLADAVLRP